MGKGTLTIYSASAGSGKTYALTEIYLKYLFRSRYGYRKILAVTFTNKATAEMKSRILDSLNILASGQESEHLSAIMHDTGKSEEWIRNESGEILNVILHDFSRFSVSTIDSFFQRILRAFAREAGLHSGFTVELDHSVILSEAVDKMIRSAAGGTQLNRWLVRYAMTNLEEERSWNLKDGIINLSEELFREKFRNFPAADRSNLENKEFLFKYIGNLKHLADSFEKKLSGLGIRAAAIFDDYGLSEEMFYRKGQGIPAYIRSLASGIFKKPNQYVREIENHPPRWATGEVALQLRNAIENGLESVLLESLSYYDTHINEYKTANAVLSNIYALGILSDVLHNIHIITTEENSFLLADAGEVISMITAEDQTPFIYEKVGTRYENFMIDEFQDTSVMQWKNLRPLMENSMSEGNDNLVVGDVKQSIYRWRNSDWRILGIYLKSKIDNDRFLSAPLVQNWRSRSNIINFNNSLFTRIPAQIDKLFEDAAERISFRSIYSEAVQSDPGKKKGGYIRIEFIESQDDQKWSDIVLEKLPSVVETLQEKGYRASDIGILVRDGNQGACVLKTFIDYSYRCNDEKRNKFNYNVVSSDSLLLSNSPAINFIISVIAWLNDTSDMLSRALMLRLYLLATGNQEAGDVLLESEKIIDISRSYYPDGSDAFLEKLNQLPLFEVTESVIGFFGLGELSSNVPYLNTFQDLVVAFTGSRSGDSQEFLEWWKTTGSKKSVVSGNQDSMRILTIHKSKGLEFKVAILPFLSWDLDHKASKQPYLWIKPAITPFNEIGVVPVKYGTDLLDTYFSESYKEEKHSVYLDNINLLYVALTRAIDVIYGFSENKPASVSSIGGVLKNAITAVNTIAGCNEMDLNRFYDSAISVFESGDIPEGTGRPGDKADFLSGQYNVSSSVESLKLKLHGENYFSAEEREKKERINYGKLMHEAFERIITASDISGSVRRLVVEGKLPEKEAPHLETRIRSLISSKEVAGWFSPENKVLTEAGILLPDGNTRRPDRVILNNGKAIIVDFKFGEESSSYMTQLDQYRSLLANMGYISIEAYIWYVDKNLIVSV